MDDNPNTLKKSALLLLVEDDPSMLEGMRDLFLMESLLETVGIDYEIEVITAGNGQDALDLMANQKPDLIVSDIMMPIMDGYGLLHEVQANPDWLHIPFIFLTAKGHKKDILEGQLLGANLYLTKPFISTELLELIKSQLDRSFQRQQTHEKNVVDLKKGILQILNHEFRTPLTYVTAYYEMLADSLQRFPNNKNFREYLRGIQAGCIRLTNLIDDFILVIELRTGELQRQLQAQAKSVSTLNKLLETAIRPFEEQARKKGIQIHFNPADNSPLLYGDEESLITIFQRLIDNAIKFSHKGTESPKHVYVTTTTKESELYITFQDEGFGFPQSVETRIFDLFFQHNRELLEQQGAGIGLTIAKGLVDLHRGRIDVESQEGVGSVFTVVLPEYSREIESTRPTIDGSPNQRIATILVVEDELDLLIGLKELLLIFDGKYRLEVLTATNGKEGLRVLQEKQVDLIISDIMMPIMDGFEFLKLVRQKPDWVQIPFVFLTAKGERQDVHRGLRSGAEVYITKPYNSDELLQLISAQLDQHFQLQGVLTQNFDSLKRSILNLITPGFRLPLSTVHEYSEALTAGLIDVQNDTELIDSLNGIRDGSTRLTRLVEDFISLAELKTGEAETAYTLREQPIYNPGLRLYEITQTCMPVAEGANTQLICEINRDLLPVFGDSVTLSEGIQRLLEFSIGLASQYKVRDVHIISQQVGDKIQFLIDLPKKLSTAEIERINKLLEEDEASLQESPDYAPSLIIAKGYVGLNNGRIQIQKDPQNACKFIVTLPVYKSPEKD